MCGTRASTALRTLWTYTSVTCATKSTMVMTANSCAPYAESVTPFGKEQKHEHALAPFSHGRLVRKRIGDLLDRIRCLRISGVVGILESKSQELASRRSRVDWPEAS